jgi:geranylgeranyl diphosphate synthase type II
MSLPPTSERHASVKTVLQKYNDIAMEALLNYLPGQEPRRHLYDLVASYPTRPGKGFRPGLCLATCRAFGGDGLRALRSAVAIELFHNAFLVHDDIEDGSEFRRGSATLHQEFGIPIAINVGDAMNVLSIRPLMENLLTLGPQMTWDVFTEIEHMVRQSVEGQAMELGWVADNECNLTDDDYLRMTLKKTCWYTIIHPCRIGALIAKGRTIKLDRFNRFGYFMGAAFQIQDDLLNLVGEREKYGKEIGGDIYEGKRTVPLIHLFNHTAPQEKDELQRFLALPREARSPEQVQWVYQLMDHYGSLAHARACASQLAGAALKEFFVAYGDQPPSEDKAFIQNIILYMIEREI